MESGTSIFEGWLETVGRMAAGRELPVMLDILSSQVEQAFGARIWFARILGRRWSYVAGLRSQRPTWSEAEKIPLADGIGLVAESWGELSMPEQERLREFLGELLGADRSVPNWG